MPIILGKQLNKYNMACDHKFNFFLRLEKLDFKPETLIVGTFNPAWPALTILLFNFKQLAG